jgi:hypothetical protein
MKAVVCRTDVVCRTLVRLFAVTCATLVALCGCAQKTVINDGYRAGVVPGISRQKVEALLGKPSSAQNFSVPGISALVLSYPFGEVLLQHDRVVVVSAVSDPNFVGPLGIKIGTPEEDLRKALLSAKAPHSSYRMSYQVMAGDIVTRTRDVYDDTGHVMFELAASNPNDPEAPFSVVSISMTNAAGSALLSSITQAKVNGIYPGQSIVNYVSEPWPSRKGP